METRVLLPVYPDCIVVLVQNYRLLVRSQEGAGQMDFTRSAAGRDRKVQGLPLELCNVEVNLFHVQIFFF